MKEFALYTVARLGIFVACYAALLVLVAAAAGREEAGELWLLIVAVLVSAVISAYALRGMRERFAARVHARADRLVANGRSTQR